jgi:CIC family chloride channel protein
MSKEFISKELFIASLKRFGRNNQIILSVLALLVGITAGVAAIAFRWGIGAFQELAYGFSDENVATQAAELPWWHLLAAPTVGGLIVGLYIHFFLAGGRPPGVANVIEANALHGGRMSLADGLKTAVASAASLGFGASVGREGPVVHLGASLGAWVAARLHLGRSLSRTLLGCGVAAAVAASFNAPIAGTLFALEVVVGHYALSAFAPIVIASVTGTMISRAYYGDFPAFILPRDLTIVSLWEFPAFAILGIVCAVAAIVFMRSIMTAGELFEKTPVPSWARPAFGGLAVGIMAIVGFPHLIGVGYEATDMAISEQLTLWMLVALIALKIAATSLCLGSGFAGGVFSPSLFLGAMVGGAYGMIATLAMPDLSSGHGVYTIVGMGALTGAVLGAPISTILMIFELTGDYTVTIAVMIATVIASVITQQFHGRSFFIWQLERRGISIKGGQEIGLMRSIFVDSVMDKTFETILSDAPVAQVRARLQDAPWGELFVVDADGMLIGTLTFSDLHEAAFDTSHDDELDAAALARKHPTVLQVHDNLEIAVQIYGASGEVHVPVVDDRASMRMIGVAHEHEVMLAYHRALDQARAEERGDL